MKNKHISISNKAFIELISDLVNMDVDEIKKVTLDCLSEELDKPRRKQDFVLIHECYLTLSECFGYEYNNEYKTLAERQQRTQKIINKAKNISIGKAAIF